MKHDFLPFEDQLAAIADTLSECYPKFSILATSAQKAAQQRRTPQCKARNVRAQRGHVLECGSVLPLLARMHYRKRY
jgi:hypothetical protein